MREGNIEESHLNRKKITYVVCHLIDISAAGPSTEETSPRTIIQLGSHPWSTKYLYMFKKSASHPVTTDFDPGTHPKAFHPIKKMCATPRSFFLTLEGVLEQKCFCRILSRRDSVEREVDFAN